DIVHVVLDRTDLDKEPFGNFLVAAVLANQLQDFALARGQFGVGGGVDVSLRGKLGQLADVAHHRRGNVGRDDRLAHVGGADMVEQSLGGDFLQYVAGGSGGDVLQDRVLRPGQPDNQNFGRLPFLGD